MITQKLSQIYFSVALTHSRGGITEQLSLVQQSDITDIGKVILSNFKNRWFRKFISKRFQLSLQFVLDNLKEFGQARSLYLGSFQQALDPELVKIELITKDYSIWRRIGSIVTLTEKGKQA